MYEERQSLARHGRLQGGGVWSMLSFPTHSYAIFGEASFNGKAVFQTEGRSGWASRIAGYRAAQDNQGMLDAGIFVKADTVEELAEKIGCDSSTLATTLEKYNADVAAGKDTLFGRGEAVMDTYEGSLSDTNEERTGEMKVVIEPFALQPIEPPFYAVEISLALINSQGGPKRNENAQTLNWDNEPIPRLYNCGEFGSIYAYMYNGGGNVGETIATGRVAGNHAANLEPWDEAE